MLAARSSNANASKLIQSLLKHGAQPPAKDFHSWTALLRAAWNGREQNVRTLIDGVDGRASDVNERDRAGWSAIMRAAWLVLSCFGRLV
jgi:ankyrin repeat protein